jgi:hypothetical protein
MDKLKKSMRILAIKLGSWEYWPIWATYLPASLYYSYLSLRAGSPFFFSAANPSIENGGMFFESKKDVYAQIPEYLYPCTVHIEADTELGEIFSKIKEKGMSFPLVAKPDRGERGWLVKIIYTTDQLIEYVTIVRRNFLLQAYVHFPMELSIFYVRHPSWQKGKITSITGKQFLSVTGDGRSTLKKLIRENPRTFLQEETLYKIQGFNGDEILPAGEEKILVRIGNHARGTTFLNYKHLIDDAMETAIDSISKKIPGFHFGRLDMVCKSVEALKQEEDFYILELNGAGAEPAHIYQPGYSYFRAQLDIMKHFKLMFDIASYFNKHGHPYMTWTEYQRKKRDEKAFKGTLKNSDL